MHTWLWVQAQGIFFSTKSPCKCWSQLLALNKLLRVCYPRTKFSKILYRWNTVKTTLKPTKNTTKQISNPIKLNILNPLDDCPTFSCFSASLQLPEVEITSGAITRGWSILYAFCTRYHLCTSRLLHYQGWYCWCISTVFLVPMFEKQSLKSDDASG